MSNGNIRAIKSKSQGGERKKRFRNNNNGNPSRLAEVGRHNFLILTSLHAFSFLWAVMETVVRQLSVPIERSLGVRYKYGVQAPDCNRKRRPEDEVSFTVGGPGPSAVAVFAICAPEWAVDTMRHNEHSAVDTQNGDRRDRVQRKRDSTCSDAMTPRQEGYVPVVAPAPCFGGNANTRYLT